ncbi:MAG: hypothetical protein KatS3mg014_2035 [Actinomycetota bacterium]|nr:MAG: hypothetical protein KatS3mg014_2035 [Actinomycetota bacterium]
MIAVAALSIGSAYVQDVFRYACFALDRVRSALVSDLIWLGVTVALLTVASVSRPDPPGLLLAWGGGAAAGALYLGMILRPRAHLLARVAAPVLRVGGWFLLSGTVYAVLTYATTLLILARAGTAGLGALRALLGVVAPLSLFAMSAEIWGMRELSARVGAPLRRAGLISAIAAVPYAAALLPALTAHAWIVRWLLGRASSATRPFSSPCSRARWWVPWPSAPSRSSA